MACAPCASTPSLPLRRRCAAFWLSFAPRTTAAGVPLSVCSHSGWFCRCTVGSFFPVLAVAAAVCVGLASAAAAVGMGLAIGKSAEGISRQPEAAGNIRTSLMLGLVFIETVVIYALIIAILVIFVL